MILLLRFLAIAQIFLGEVDIILDSQLSSIESGFEKVWHSLFISSPFFFLAALFVLFDLELILLIPLLLGLRISIDYVFNLSLILFVITITLIIEWAVAGLKWQV